MQVARAAGTPSKLPGSRSAGSSLRAATSYAPLYLTSSLRDIAFDIEELEGIALDRLKVLKAAEAARSAAGLAPRTVTSVDTIRSAIRAAERAAGLNIPPPGNADRDDRVLKDEASHFLLRLALCKTHEHRNWLLATEHDLFNARLEGAGAEFAFRAIEKADGPVVRSVTAAEMDRFRAELDAVTRGPGRFNGDPGRYYTVAFEEVPALVRHRRVFVRNGVAFVPERNVLDILGAQFRSKLSLALVTASKAVGLADGDQRMRPILESIRQHYSIDEQADKGFDPSLGIERINLNQINESMPSMPLCMANMMTRLREQHHLRHSGRMQLGVFLKGCGLSVDESLRFWRTEFGKGSINSDKFEKTYAYNIRHHYGKEGKRRNLPPFACVRVINERPGPGEHNGCPYREFEESRLKQALRSIGTEPNAISAIAAKAREGNFQTACGMCFASSQPGHHAFTDNGLPEYIPTHPNEYFIEARKRRCAPEPEVQMLDEDIDDEEMLMVAAAVESQNSVEMTPKKDAARDDGQGESVPETPVIPSGKADTAHVEVVEGSTQTTAPNTSVTKSAQETAGDGLSKNVEQDGNADLQDANPKMNVNENSTLPESPVENMQVTLELGTTAVTAKVSEEGEDAHGNPKRQKMDPNTS